jgi:putative transcriptional regulator
MLEAHLAGCAACRAGVALLRDLPQGRLPGALWDRLRQRIEDGGPRGARMAVLAHDPAAHSILLIGHMPPRRTFPRHLHLGPEDIAVLTGGYEDDRGHYEAGEYSAYEPGSSHEPVTEAGEPCWTLTRLEKPNRFFGWHGLLMRLLS